jgi:hypothetical protein
MRQMVAQLLPFRTDHPVTTYSQHIRRAHEVKQMRTSTVPARTAAVAPPTMHPDAFHMSGGPATASVTPLALPRFPRRPRAELMCAQPQVGAKRRVSLPRVAAHCGWQEKTELSAVVQKGRVVLYTDLQVDGVPVRLDAQGRISLTASMCLHLGVDVGDQVQVIGDAGDRTATLLSLTRALELMLEAS